MSPSLCIAVASLVAALATLVPSPSAASDCGWIKQEIALRMEDCMKRYYDIGRSCLLDLTACYENANLRCNVDPLSSREAYAAFVQCTYGEAEACRNAPDSTCSNNFATGCRNSVSGICFQEFYRGCYESLDACDSYAYTVLQQCIDQIGLEYLYHQCIV